MSVRSPSFGSSSAAPALVALLDSRPGDADGAGEAGEAGAPRLVLAAPAVGLWRDAPAPGSLITPGADLGALEILGVLHALSAPPGAHGIARWPAHRGATTRASHLSRQPVGYGDALFWLDTAALGASPELAASGPAAHALADGELAFRAPMSGRFYSRPAPDQPAFVAPGDIVQVGATVGLLEVMKTFNRVSYGGAGLPERARVTAVVPGDESDLAAGDIILLLEAAS